MNLEAALKAIFTAIIGGGILIASFYFAYLLLIILILGGLYALAYLFYNRGSHSDEEDFYD